MYKSVQMNLFDTFDGINKIQSTYFVMGPVLSSLCGLIQLSSLLHQCSYYPRFSDKETEARRVRDRVRIVIEMGSNQKWQNQNSNSDKLAPELFNNPDI